MKIIDWERVDKKLNEFEGTLQEKHRSFFESLDKFHPKNPWLGFLILLLVTVALFWFLS